MMTNGECKGWIFLSYIPTHTRTNDPYASWLSNIRIYHECEGGIEKSVPRVAVWHHEACRVMANGDPEGLIFLFYPYTNNGFFFLLTTVFINLFILK